MPSAAAKQALSPTMSKADVCAYVGKSKRTIDNYIATGRLAVAYFQGPNGKTGIFQRADVEALKVDLETPTYRPPVVRESNYERSAATAVGPHVPEASRLQHFLAEVLRAYPVDRIRPWLTLAEAADYSGLPAGWLLAQAREGKCGSIADPPRPGVIRAINVGTGSKEFWRFHRASLTK
jgi:hypothetical protein